MKPTQDAPKPYIYKLLINRPAVAVLLINIRQVAVALLCVMGGGRDLGIQGVGD